MTKRNPDAICRAKGCTELVNSLGWCKSHYDMRRMSDPEKRERNRQKCREWYQAHRAEAKVKNAARYQTDKARRAAVEREKKFGISQAAFDALLLAQSGRCAICRSDKAGGRGGFAVDHCHITGRVRGLLCTNCNNGLGRFKDDPDRLIAAADYLRKPAPPS